MPARLSKGKTSPASQKAKPSLNKQNIYLNIKGFKPKKSQKAKAGDIITIACLKSISIGDTLADPDNPIALPPSSRRTNVQMTFGVNTSPFSGKEGKWGTSRKLLERLQQEMRTNIALKVEQTESADTFLVSGRGELHLGILIETMRREGYEFQSISPCRNCHN